MHEHQDTKHITINLLITKLQNNIHNNQPPTHQENQLSSLSRWQGKYYPSSTTWSITTETDHVPIVKSSANQQQPTDQDECTTHRQWSTWPTSLYRYQNTALRLGGPLGNFRYRATRRIAFG